MDRAELAAGITLVGLALAMTAGCGSAPSPQPSHTPAATTSSTSAPATASPSSPTGRVVFSDDFSASGNGWSAIKLPSGSTMGYADSHYVMSGVGNFNDYSLSPYQPFIVKQAIAVDLTLRSATALGAGAGVFCNQANGVAVYYFEIGTDGNYYVGKQDSTTTSNAAVLLTHGTAGLNGVGVANHIDASCISTATNGTTTTELILTVNGGQLVDLRDSWSQASATGWHAGLIVTGTVDASFDRFQIRDLSG